MSQEEIKEKKKRGKVREKEQEKGRDEDTNNQFFVRMLVDVARRSGVRVIACGIERQEEKDVTVRILQGLLT